MKKFVSYEKMSKKQQREINRQKRGTWQCSPVTRIADTDKKHYSRKIKHKNSGGDSSLPLYLLIKAVSPADQKWLRGYIPGGSLRAKLHSGSSTFFVKQNGRKLHAGAGSAPARLTSYCPKKSSCVIAFFFIL